jgi:hypothetical protein
VTRRAAAQVIARPSVHRPGRVLPDTRARSMGSRPHGARISSPRLPPGWARAGRTIHSVRAKPVRRLLIAACGTALSRRFEHADQIPSRRCKIRSRLAGQFSGHQAMGRSSLRRVRSSSPRATCTRLISRTCKESPKPLQSSRAVCVRGKEAHVRPLIETRPHAVGRTGQRERLRPRQAHADRRDPAHAGDCPDHGRPGPPEHRRPHLCSARAAARRG